MAAHRNTVVESVLAVMRAMTASTDGLRRGARLIRRWSAPPDRGFYSTYFPELHNG